MTDLAVKVMSGGCVVAAAVKAGMVSNTEHLIAAGPMSWLPDPSVIQIWAPLIAGGAIYAWHEWRKGKRQIIDDREYERDRERTRRTLDKIHKANDKAIEAGAAIPFPEFIPKPDEHKHDEKDK